LDKIMPRLFNNLLLIYFALLIFEQFQTIKFIESSHLLLIVIFTGGFAAKRHATKRPGLLSLGFGLCSFLILVFLLKQLWPMNLVIALISSLFLFVCAYNLMTRSSLPKISKKRRSIIFMQIVALLVIYLLATGHFMLGTKITLALSFLLVPGFLLARCLTTSMQETLVLSCAFSLGLLPTTMFLLGLFGLPINFLSIFTVNLILIIITFLIYQKRAHT